MKEMIESSKRLQGDIDKCIMKLIHARQYHDKIEEAGAVIDMESLLVASAQQLQCCIDKLEECGSVVEWQTGEPDEVGCYLVTLNGGYIDVAFYMGDHIKYFAGFISENIIAWCKLSNIEPYKEKEE